VLEWDFFGIESSYYPFSNLDMLNDAMRLDLIAALLARGHAERVVISHDICTVTRLRRMGGHGYTHITNAIEPMMQRKGFSEQQIAQILVQTPRRLLTLA
jgi:phosphotriesterase-related protein